MIDYDDPLVRGYLKRLVGENGITLLKTIPDGEHTDEEMYGILNPLRKAESDAENEIKYMKEELKILTKKISSESIDEETGETPKDMEKRLKKIEKSLAKTEKELKKLKQKTENEDEITLNEIRKILFILGENKFTICKRERDTNSGWLTFRWKLNMVDLSHQLEREKRKLYRNLLRRLEYERENLFYICPNHCVRLIFDDATETEFMCPLCGDNLTYEDNDIIKELLERRVKEYQNADPKMFRKERKIEEEN